MAIRWARPRRPFHCIADRGVKITGGVKDRGDGSYGVTVVWDPSISPTPGVLVNQPDRNPVTVTPTDQGPAPAKDCSEPAETCSIAWTEGPRVRQWRKERMRRDRSQGYEGLR